MKRCTVQVHEFCNDNNSQTYVYESGQNGSVSASASYKPQPPFLSCSLCSCVTDAEKLDSQTAQLTVSTKYRFWAERWRLAWMYLSNAISTYDHRDFQIISEAGVQHKNQNKRVSKFTNETIVKTSPEFQIDFAKGYGDEGVFVPMRERGGRFMVSLRRIPPRTLAANWEFKMREFSN